MAFLHEHLSAQFHEWESQGRGCKLLPHPVCPEPPFRPFNGYYLPEAHKVDDGRRPTLLNSLFQRFANQWNDDKPPILPPAEDEAQALEPFIRSDVLTWQLSFPSTLDSKPIEFVPLLSELADSREPLAFEIIGVPGSVCFQFAAHPEDARTLQRRLKARFPHLAMTSGTDPLSSHWLTHDERESLVIEFGLSREFILPLSFDAPDLFLPLLTSLIDISKDEAGLFQVLFQPVNHAWAEHAVRAVTDAEGKPMFVNAPELAERVREKNRSPLIAVVLRLAAQSPDYDRTLAIVRDMAVSLRSVARMDGNELHPLSNRDYPYADHVSDVALRQCRRHGMLLNTQELSAFIHLPSRAIRQSVGFPEPQKSKAAPQTPASGLLLGTNPHDGQSVEVRLSPEARTRHMHVIGASGSGKSTLLLNLISQDILNGEGVAVLDPHGDLIDAILGMIPQNRIDDVVLLDPSDETHAVGFNILSAHSELERTLLASDLVSVFERLSTSWGDQMNSVLRNAIMAFLDSSEGGTLAELRRFLLEPDFRKRFLKTVQDSEVLYYWQHGFTHLTGNKSIGPIITRLDGFLAPKPIRHMVSQKENRLDFAHIMDRGKIFLAKLSQGQMGRENVFLLGSLMVGKFQETAMSRQAQAASERRPFWLYVDEFQSFITPSMAEILSGTRKYGLGLILAHQELRQLEREREVASAVLTHAYTRVCFRLGDDDAHKLADGFSAFDARDLQSLSRGQAICRLERADADFNLSVPLLEKPDPKEAAETRQRVVTRSREQYARPRAEVEAELRERLMGGTPPAPEAKLVKKTTSLAPKAEPPPEPPAAAEASKPPTPPPPLTPAASATLPEPLPTDEEDIPKSIPPAPVATPPAIVVAAPKTAESPKDMGRGGAQHKAIQKRIKNRAEELGFRGVIEKSVLDGHGSIDLWIGKASVSIGCEISFTTTIEHEVDNITKCLKAEVPMVAVICQDDERLRQIAAAVATQLDPQAAAKVEYFQPDDFISHLEQIASALPPTLPSSVIPKKSNVFGYEVDRNVPTLSPEERSAREATALKIIMEAMKKKKP